MVRCLFRIRMVLKLNHITLKRITMKRKITYGLGIFLMLVFTGISLSSTAQTVKKKYPDGTIVYTDGSVRHPNGVITYPNSTSTRYPTGTVRTLPDGSVVYPDGTIHRPGGVYTYPTDRAQRY